MGKDKYALELERAIFNWYYGGETAGQEPVGNAIRAGLAHGMQVWTRDEMLETEKHKGYFLPLFTSLEEMHQRDGITGFSRPLKDLLESANNQGDCLGCIINPLDKKLILEKETIQALLQYKPKPHLTLVRGSVVDMHVGAIVNAANQSLLGGGGVDGAIHRAAGPDLLKECRTLGGCHTGEAKLTGAYRINHADYIIHTVGPIYSGQEADGQLLAACYKNSLDLALEKGCTSIAFPGISTGVYGYPLEEAAKVSLKTVARFMEEHPDMGINIYFCCFRDRELAVYQGMMGRNSQETRFL